MSPLIGQTNDDGFMISVAPMVRLHGGKFEALVAVIYNKDGDPITAILAGEGREVPIAETELIDPLPRIPEHPAKEWKPIIP